MLYSLVLPVRISWHVITSAGIVYYLYKRGLPDSPLTVGVGLMLGAVVLCIPYALDSRLALENSWSWLINGLMFLCLIQLIRNGNAPTLFNAHYVAGAIVAGFALVEYAITKSRPSGLFDNINLTGAYSAALIVPVYSAAREASQRRYYLLAALLLIAVFITESRGGLISLGVGLMVYHTLTLKQPLWVKGAVWLATALGLFLIVLSYTRMPGHASGDTVRLKLWGAASEMIQEYPAGVGAGLFPHAIDIEENRFTGAHNHYLTLGAELGGLGLFAGAVLFFLWLRCVIAKSAWSRSELAALAALVGIAAHMLVDNYPSSNWALLVGLYAAYVAYEDRLSIPRRALQFAGVFITLILLEWSGRMLQYDYAQVFYESAIFGGRQYDAYTALELDPDNALYRLEVKRLQGSEVPISPISALVLYGRPYR